jgi:hypothetical protein
MSSVNASTSYSGFHLKTGYSPKLFPSPPAISPYHQDEALKSATYILHRLKDNIFQAKDNLLAVKTVQAYYANEYRCEDPGFVIGDHVWLNTANRRQDYMQKGSGRAAKFMPRFDGPFRIIKAHPESSSYTLELPPSSTFHATFHVSQLRKFVPNDSSHFPSRDKASEPVLVEGNWEHVIDRIIDERKRGRGTQFLVQWKGFSASHNEWIPERLLKDNSALDEWETHKASTNDN